MRILRLILFFPGAVIASVLVGAAGYWFGNLGFWIYNGSELLAWIYSGIGSSIGFMIAGMQVAPKATETIKRALAVGLAIIGTFSGAVPLILGLEVLASLSGLVMLIFAVSAFMMPVEMFGSE